MWKAFKQSVLRRLHASLEHHSRHAHGVRFASRGQGVRISYDCRFVKPEGIWIGDYVYVGPHGFWAGGGGLRVGDNVAIGPHVHIYTENHRYEDADFVPFDDVIVKEPVEIGDHVWIGGNCVIVPGVSIGEGAVVAAGSVVSSDVPRCAVVGGNPAKVLKYRDAGRFDRLAAEGKWFNRHEVQQTTAP